MTLDKSTMPSNKIAIPGMEIACKTWGKTANPPVLALHGWLDNAGSFDWIASYLEKNYYVIAIDLPGHGLSSHLPEGCHYHFIDGIFKTVDVIKGLGFKKVHLLGHSLGACLASLLAGVAPEYIRSLALIEGLGPFTHPEDTARKQLHDYMKHQIPNNNSSKNGYSSLEMAAQARAKRGHVSIELARKLCERGLEKKNDLYFWRHDRRLLIPSPLRMTEGQVLSCLEGITSETCLIWADNGFDFNSDQINQRINCIKDISTHALEGGHHIHMEKPEKVADILLDFFRNK